jgi:hypothetical protein
MPPFFAAFVVSSAAQRNNKEVAAVRSALTKVGWVVYLFSAPGTPAASLSSRLQAALALFVLTEWALKYKKHRHKGWEGAI